MVERQSARMSEITNDRLNPVWHRMLYIAVPMATVGVKALITTITWFKKKPTQCVVYRAIPCCLG